jgi:hypothetical protein
VASFTVTIPDDKLADLVSALCARYGYSAEFGVTRSVFARDQIRVHLVDTYKQWKAAQALTAAAVQSETAATTDTANWSVS